jgi:hypothetical protein
MYDREKAGFFLKYIGVYLAGPLCWLTGYAWYIALTKKKKRYANAALCLLFACIIFFLLIGNKFTTPLYATANFMLSASAFLLMDNKIKLMKIRVLKFVVFALLLLTMLTGTMYKVYFIDRGYKLEYFLAFLEQRVLIAPSQLVWSAYERIFSQSGWTPLEAFQLTIFDPLPMDANPSVNYLMYQELGPCVVNYAAGFTDAYPGIVFELFGPYMTFPILCVMGFVYAYTLYRLVKYTAQQKFMPASLFFFVVQALTMFFVQGQLLFLTSSKFYCKIAIVYLLMQFISRRIILQQPRTALMDTT